MKTLIFISIATVFLCNACYKQNAAPETPLNETVDTTTSNNVTSLYKGDFMNGPYGTVTGTAKVFVQNGKYTLALENMQITNGPDLHVYLSKEVQPVNFIDCGKLKSTNGNQVYDIPVTPDFSQYKYALVHCQQYNHLFGSAALK